MAKTFIKSLADLVRQIFCELFGRKDDEEHQDHPLLKDHVSSLDYATAYARYPSISSFYHPHAHTDKLKSIADLPLLVFIHGIGGSLPQFAPLLKSFVNIAPAFAIELPGHGKSEFAPTDYGAYTFEACTELWRTAVEDTCTRYGHRRVVLICHSMGCSVGAALASRREDLGFEIIGMAAICPKADPPTQSQTSTYRRMLSLPDFALDILRWFDRLGGESSKSVERFVGDAAGLDLKRQQLAYNRQFRTPVWKRITVGLLPRYDSDGTCHRGLPGRSVWQSVRVPLLLIAGEGDTVTKPEEANRIVAYVQGRTNPDTLSSSATNGLPIVEENSDKLSNGKAPPDPTASDEHYGLQPTVSTDSTSLHSQPLKSIVLPIPASHALMYDHSTYRTCAGLIEDFLSKNVSRSLELGWQLQQLTTSGKWDVKNLEKWKKVLPVSGPIDNNFFRALKTLREQDPIHCPSEFQKKWSPSGRDDGRKGDDRIYAVIDISHDSPVYDTKALEKGGIQYHKFPTVSKIPPTHVEVKDFITLVDHLRGEIDEKYKDGEGRRKPAIAVHCHYGFNRTGFFIISYMVSRRGWKLPDAIEEFARAKPPGIKHEHFIDTLFVRHCEGLRRNSTVGLLNGPS